MNYRNILWFAVMLLSACANAGIPRTGSGPGSVAFTVHDRSYDEVWRAVEKVSNSLLTVVESNKNSGTLKASRGVVMGPWGDIVSFSIRPADKDASAYTIGIQSLQHPEARLSRQDWINTIIIRIKAELRQ